MKKVTTMSGALLFSTILGLVLPVGSQISGRQASVSQTIVAKADDTDLKANNIEDATNKVNEAVDQAKLDSTVNLDATSSDTVNQLQAKFEANLAVSKKGLQKYIDDYTSGKLTDQQFLSNVNTNIIAGLGNKPLPIDWGSAAQLVSNFADRRQQQVSEANVTDSQLVAANKIAKESNVVQNSNASNLKNQASRANLAKKVSYVASLYITNNIDGTQSAKTDKPNTTQLEDANYFLEKMADSRKNTISSLKSVSDSAKATAISAVDSALAADKEKVTSSSMTVGDLASLVTTAASDFQKIAPASDLTVATDSDRSAALATLNNLNKTANESLDGIKGFDDDVKTAKAKVADLYAKYKSQIEAASTLTDLGTIATKSKQDFAAQQTLYPTDAERQAAIKAINDAVTTQIAAVNADQQASDADKARAITTINNTANRYIPLIKMSNTTVQVMATAETGAVSSIKAVTPMHSQPTTTTTGTTTSTSGITTAQRNAAMNAVITAGNTKKVAIQNDASIEAADKTAAYDAIDKLVTSYTDQMKDAKTPDALASLQDKGVTAVTGYTAGKTTTAPAATGTQKTTKKVIYALSRVKLYKSNSLKGSVVASYAKHKRISRPTFLVTKTITNTAGKKVYYVQNQASGKKGYLTSSTKVVAYAYYQTTPKKVRVIATKGVNQYKKSNLTTKQKHTKKGQTLNVKKVIKSGLTTRFQLTNGSYVSANKKFVIDTAY